VSDGHHRQPSRLERRARHLLRAYPPAYRADRGEEILGTLLEATPPGRDWPSAREAASVIGGGLRTRRQANQRQGVPASLGQAVILGITLTQAINVMELPSGSQFFLPEMIALAAPLAMAVVLTWLLRRRIRTSGPAAS
jgi:hypothetical protein